MEELLIGAGIEAVKMAMQLYLTLATQAGMTDEEIDQMLVEERAKFEANRPDLLPKPPED